MKKDKREELELKENAEKKINGFGLENKLKIYNTMSRSVEDFTPIDEDNVRVYTCGPTVYHYAHVGNMRAYVFADLLQRTLRTLYPTVTHVINITDVGHLVGDGDQGEDKLEKGSKREGKSVWDIAKYYTDAFMNDLNLLNIDADNYIFPRATDFIKEQINNIEKLERRGYTYTTADGIYFDTSKYANYGELAKLDIKNLQAGERIEMGEKKNKTDFALWKFSPADQDRQMEWIFEGDKKGLLIDQEFKILLSDQEKKTAGFPGWHIECSAMSEAILGKHFDIHTGGIDHIPVHHTNEIAQSECAHDNEKGYNGFVNYWCHVNFLNDKSGKMSKSNDEFLRLKTLQDKDYNINSFKYLLYTTSYRKELEFSYESLDAANTAFIKLCKYMNTEAKVKENIVDATKYRINTPVYDEFMSAIYNDLNTSSALAVMWDMLSNKSAHAYSTMLAMNKILGFNLEHKEESLEDKLSQMSDSTKNKILEMLEQRKIARANKDWATSDVLRSELQAHGVEVVD